MRYRKKPVEVDAWQVGSDEPMPEWALRYLSRFPHIEERYSGIWLVQNECGNVLIRTRYQFERDYEAIE